MAFKSDFEVRHLPEGRKYLLKELIFDDPEHGRIVVYPKYITGRHDGRKRLRLWKSVNKLTWGRCDRAELIRDYLYNGGITHCSTPSKKEADDVFHRAMITDGTSKWRRITLYSYVTLFGKPLWKGWNR